MGSIGDFLTRSTDSESFSKKRNVDAVLFRQYPRTEASDPYSVDCWWNWTEGYIKIRQLIITNSHPLQRDQSVSSEESNRSKTIQNSHRRPPWKGVRDEETEGISIVEVLARSQLVDSGTDVHQVKSDPSGVSKLVGFLRTSACTSAYAAFRKEATWFSARRVGRAQEACTRYCITNGNDRTLEVFLVVQTERDVLLAFRPCPGVSLHSRSGRW